MLTSLLLGAAYGFAAAVQPGPLQAFLVSRVAASGWRRTLPACVAPLLSDGPVAVLAIVVVGRLPVVAQTVLQAAGGQLLIVLGALAFLRWRRSGPAGDAGSAPRTLAAAVLVNLLNPNPYLAWALVLGPAMLAAWAARPAHAVALIGAFYGTMVTLLAAFVVLVGTVRFLGSRAQRALVGLSAALLVGLGIFLLASAVLRL